MKVNQPPVVFLLLSVFSFLYALPGYPQEGKRFRRLSLQDGLSQSTVECIFKDHQGYMWFGTRDGLNKYDGYKITVYRHDPQKKESIGNNIINDLVEDRQGQLWIATAAGLERFERGKDSFQHYSLDVSSRNVSVLFLDSRDRLWAGTDAGLYRLNGSLGTVAQVYRRQPDKANSLIHNQINAIAEDDQGELWIATDGGLDRFNEQTQRFTHYQHQDGDPTSLRSDLVKAVFKDGKGRIWAGLRKGGVALFNRNRNSFLNFEHNPADANTVAHNDVLSLAEGWDGKLWIGTENGGISILDMERKSFANYRQDNLDPGSLSNNSIHALYRDGQGNMWAGTWAGGVSYLPRFADKFVRYSRIPGTNSTNVYAIGGDWEGNVWLGLENEGLLQFNPRSRTFQSHKNPNQGKWDASIILSIKEVNKDTLALACRQGGFAFFDKTKARFMPFLANPSRSNSISEGEKTTVWVDRDENSWIGDFENGLSFYDHQTKGFINYTANQQDTNSLGNGKIRALCEDGEGNIWIGTEGGGLACFDRQRHRFSRYVTEGQGGGNNKIETLLKDRQGNLWLGTYGEGLKVFNPRTHTYRVYSQQQGLPSNIVEAILEDGKGNLWVGTNHGIARFNPQTRTFRTFDTQDGLQGNAFNRNACYQDAAGTMYFGGTDGFNVFHPDSIQDNPHVPPIALTDFQIFNHSIKAGERNSPLVTPISEAKAITLAYWQSVFSFEFAALDFTQPGKNQYAYRLEGFDERWNPIGTQRKATYTNLDPGEYTFRVRASNNDGVWNKKGISIRITVAPPFWLTWWFKSVAILLVVAVVGTVYRIKTRQITTKNKELEARVVERTQKIERQKQEIAAHRDTLEQLNEELERKVMERTQDLQVLNHELAANEEELRQTLDHTLEINEELTESKAILAEAQRIAHLGSWELQLTPQKIIWSEETHRIFGRKLGATPLSYEQVLDRFLPEYREALDQAIQEAIHQGKAYEVEMQILTESDQVRWTLIVGKPALDDQGTVVKLIGTVVDITERKLAEQQLQQQNQELRKINAELDSFVYRASHDLRAPLSSLLGLISITKEEPREEVKGQYFQLMEKSIGKLDTFIQGIINYSKNARLEVASKPIDFQELVDETFDDLRYMDGSNEIDKQLTIKGDTAFFSDAFRLKIIFSNVISNAIRYRNPRVDSFIHIRIAIDNQQASLAFTDNGYGIAQESIGKIFEMFYRASGENVGSGLGLYIVKEVVEALKGEIQVESQEGKGTCFQVILPNLKDYQRVDVPSLLLV